MPRHPLQGDDISAWFFGLDRKAWITAALLEEREPAAGGAAKKDTLRPVGLLRHYRDPFTAPWLTATHALVLLSLEEASKSGAVNVLEYEAKMRAFRQSESELRRRLKKQAPNKALGSDLVCLDKVYWKEGALLPPDGILCRCHKDAADRDNPRHPFCPDQVEQYWGLAAGLALGESRLSWLAWSLRAVARQVAPAGAELCERGWAAVEEEAHRAADIHARREKITVERLRLPKEVNRSFLVKAGISETRSKEWRSILSTLRHLERLSRAEVPELEALFVKKVLEVRPRTSEEDARRAFRGESLDADGAPIWPGRIRRWTREGAVPETDIPTMDEWAPALGPLVAAAVERLRGSPMA